MEPILTPHTASAVIHNQKSNTIETIIPPAVREASTISVSEYQAQLNTILNRIENSTTHYEALGLEPSASYDNIVMAFYSVVNMLYPAHQIRIALGEQLIERIDGAFHKAAWALTTLANFKKRADYHSNVLSRATGTRPAFPLPTNAVNAPENKPEPIALPADSATARKVVQSEVAEDKKEGNRRRNERFKLAMPVRVIGYEKNSTKWEEKTESVDVSRTGVTIRLKKNIRYGNILNLTLPLPAKFRERVSADFNYNVYAIVRRIEPRRAGSRVVALEFLGERPPDGFKDKPWEVFKSQNWTGAERRRWPRVNRQERVRLEYFDNCARLISREEAVTENVSPTGMRIFVKLAPFEFDLVRVICVTRKFESLAIVRNRFVAKDGIERLCVQFLKRD